MIKKYFFLVIILLISIFANSQKTEQFEIDSLLLLQPKIKIDSLKAKNLILLSQAYISVNPNLGLFYGNKSLELAEKIKWKRGIGQAFKMIGQNYVTLDNLKKADYYYEKSLKFTTNRRANAKLLLLRAWLETLKSNYSKALEYSFQSLKLNELIKNEQGIAKSNYLVAYVYNYLQDNVKAIIYNEKSLKINLKLNLQKEICDNYVLFGEIYRAKNQQYDLALQYFQKALNFAEKIEDKSTIAHVNSTISQIYQLQDKFELSLKHVLIAKKIAIAIQNKRLIAGIKLDEGLIYLLQFEQSGNNSKKQFLLTNAENLLKSALVDFEKSNDKFNISVCYDYFTYLYQLQNKDKKATLMALKFAAIKDSIFTEKAKETVKTLEDQRTIDLKNKEILINSISLENKEKQKWIYIFGIGFLTILGFSLFQQSQNRKKTNLKLEILNQNLDQANKTKIKFLSILNHDLRSPVYNFIHFMQLQKESPDLLDNKTKKEIESKTIMSAENLLISMEDILLWSKGQMDNFKPQFKKTDINSIFEYAKKHFESEDKVRILFENQDNISLITDENFLKTIIRNLTGNAIKALDCFVPRNDNDKPKIIWNVYKTDNQIYLSISDNGAGANEDNLKALFDDTEVVGIKTGLGLHLIRDLAKAIKCEISVNSKLDIGTTFILKFQS